ncbi:MAG TPA: class IV adenylate cyclase [Planctomycetaceae bacterium]|nr:class IV adenylate cyclase [Planctomycetaceae bacterium]
MASPIAPGKSSIEVEQKFRLPEPDVLLAKLLAAGATEIAIEYHADTYYRHPSRDFAQTREALRIRRITRSVTESSSATNESAQSPETRVTYKGPYSTTGVKARPELEWRLDPCDEDGRNMQSLFDFLGFASVMTVRKTRRSFTLAHRDRELIVTIDDAESLGTFAEVETIAADDQEIEACRDQISELAEMLDLRSPEQKSYLTMAMEFVSENVLPS